MECLRERRLPVDFNQCWAEALRRDDGTYSRRLEDDGTEKAFWKTFMAKKDEYHQDENAGIIMKEIERILADYELKTILEIGPGWGNYTLDLSRLCTSLDCVDSSEDVLSYIRKAAKQKGRSNIRCLSGKWEDVILSSRYDMIFGYNCFYRMRNLQEIFEKMNRYADKLCMVGMGMGVCPPYCAEIEKVFTRKPIYEKKDYIYFVNILYAMGIDPNVKMIPLSRKKRADTLEEAAKQEVRELFGNNEEAAGGLNQVQEILYRYWKTGECGEWEYEYHFRGALVYWEPNGSGGSDQ